MRSFCKFFKIKHDQRRICDRFAEYSFRIILECRFQFFLCAVRIYERSVNAHLFDRMCVEIICTAVKG